jgi:hypothetical protein
VFVLAATFGAQQLAAAQSISAVPQITVHQPWRGRACDRANGNRLLVDRQNLYIGVICFDDEPQNIPVSQSRCDADLDDTDSIQILLDTFNDGQVMAEGQAGQGNRGGFNLDWDADWIVRSGMTARGWEAEFATPLKRLFDY